MKIMKCELTAIIEKAPEGGYWAISPEDLDAFSQIRGVFQRGLEGGTIVSQQNSEALALLVWSQVHGLYLIDEQVEIVGRGLSPRF